MAKKDNLFGWLDFGTGIAGVAANVLSTILTNKKNQEIAREQNALQIRESEKAYERGKPINQVAQMQAAGMSKAGALNAINGGATYQPAPITSAQAQAPQIDLSSAFDGLMQIGENAKQRKMQEDLQAKQIKAAEDAQKAQIASDEKKHTESLQTQKDIAQLQADTTNRNADNRLNFDKEQFDKLSPYQIRQITANINKVEADTNVSLQNLEKLKYDYAEYVANRSMRDAVSLFEEASAIYNYTVTEKDFMQFRENYMYYDDDTKEWKYTEISEKDKKILKYATRFWDWIAQVLPANKIADIVRLALRK